MGSEIFASIDGQRDRAASAAGFDFVWVVTIALWERC